MPLQPGVFKIRIVADSYLQPGDNNHQNVPFLAGDELKKPGSWLVNVLIYLSFSFSSPHSGRTWIGPCKQYPVGIYRSLMGR